VGANPREIAATIRQSRGAATEIPMALRRRYAATAQSANLTAPASGYPGAPRLNSSAATRRMPEFATPRGTRWAPRSALLVKSGPSGVILWGGSTAIIRGPIADFLRSQGVIGTDSQNSHEFCYAQRATNARPPFSSSPFAERKATVCSPKGRIVTSASTQQTARPVASRRSAGEIWLSALTYWYLTGLLAALGFSLGLHFMRPAARAVPENRDWLDAIAWQGGKWYKQIATEGYEYDPDKNTNIAYFPLYPLLGRAVMRVTGLRPEAALLIVSNLSLLLALAMLAFYIRDRYPDAPTNLADYAVAAAALFPTGCFYRFAYSESTFLCLAILAMYTMVRRWPLWVISLVIGLATAARPVGVALLTPFAIHIVRRAYHGEASVRQRADPHRPEARASGVVADGSCEARESEASTSGSGQSRVVPPRSRFGLVCAWLVLFLPLACWGLGVFIYYQYRTFGEPLAFVKVQKNWGEPIPWRDKAIALAMLKPAWRVYDPNSRSFWTRRDAHAVPWFSLQFATRSSSCPLSRSSHSAFSYRCGEGLVSTRRAGAGSRLKRPHLQRCYC
jgi:hypothetical protein